MLEQSRPEPKTIPAIDENPKQNLKYAPVITTTEPTAAKE